MNEWEYSQQRSFGAADESPGRHDGSGEPPAGRLRGASSPPTTIHVIISPFCRQRMFLDAAHASNSSQLVPSCPTNTPACSTLAPMSIAAARMLNSASRSIAPDQHHLQHPPPPPPPPTGAFLQTLKRSLLSRPFWSFFDVSCSSLPSKPPETNWDVSVYTGSQEGPHHRWGLLLCLRLSFWFLTPEGCTLLLCWQRWR